MAASVTLAIGGFQAAGAQPAAQAQPAQAQPAEAQAGPRLEIPQNANFIGRPQEPNVARATAIVNDEIITRSDIEQRVALFVASQRVQLPPEELERLRAQVLRNLIDETLQIQAAKENEVVIEPREIDQYYARFAQGFGHTAATFSDYLRTIGSSERSVKRQIHGELAWQQLQRRLIRVSVNDGEVRNILERLTASRGTTEYRVAEIYLSNTPETASEVRTNAGRIVQQIRAGASFTAYARQFSEASTAAVGGDLGWVRAEQLPPELAAIVQAMPVGAISDPVQVPGGFSVVALIDSRQVLVANPRDAVLSLMQMSIDLPQGTTEATARQRAEQLARATQAMGGCGRAAEVAQSVGAELVSNDAMRVRDLPPQLQQTVLGMSVGQATQPFGTLERISVLVLCGRDDPEAAAAPTFAAIADQLEEERMNRQAQRYLRDLRRDAVVEYR
ncbi:MAG TPA: peptidylprolyl isomerase [Allosphingosinicella sp.]